MSKIPSMGSEHRGSNDIELTIPKEASATQWNAGFCGQLGLMCWKTLMLKWRQKIAWLVEILVPMLMCLILIALRGLLSVEHVESGTMGNVYGTDLGGGFINTPSDVVNGTTDYPCFFPCRENRVYYAPATADDLGVAQDFCEHMQTRMAGWYALMRNHHENAGLGLNGTCSIPSYKKGQYSGEKNHIFEGYSQQSYYQTPASACYISNPNSTTPFDPNSTWGGSFNVLNCSEAVKSTPDAMMSTIMSDANSATRYPWAGVIIGKTATNQWSYTIRMNTSSAHFPFQASGVVSSGSSVARNGGPQMYAAEYAQSGFTTIQTVLDNWIMKDQEQLITAPFAVLGLGAAWPSFRVDTFAKLILSQVFFILLVGICFVYPIVRLARAIGVEKETRP